MAFGRLVLLELGRAVLVEAEAFGREVALALALGRSDVEGLAAVLLFTVGLLVLPVAVGLVVEPLTVGLPVLPVLPLVVGRPETLAPPEFLGVVPGAGR